MTDIGSEAPAWLAVPNARTGETPATVPGTVPAGVPATVPGAVPGGAPAGPAGAPGAGAHPAGHQDAQDAAGGVETALSPLGRLAEAPVSEHVGIFEDVLTGLEAVLTSVDEPLPDSER
ncbi:hypothetical protein Psi02_45380 [Planotetraspora silvatica]|uniref:Uncharacterized protein n=1 Tax=Planotetraspora silvatica TaxID=234614 RepID=A0A8J3ULM9_9ACTN|nr:hypothetical protein [Planotetraspora silvatica]GII48114.1 hypothetical protein Psi02_45380 [Planotetraspora silvatica]